MINYLEESNNQNLQRQEPGVKNLTIKDKEEMKTPTKKDKTTEGEVKMKLMMKSEIEATQNIRVEETVFEETMDTMKNSEVVGLEVMIGETTEVFTEKNIADTMMCETEVEVTLGQDKSEKHEEIVVTDKPEVEAVQRHDKSEKVQEDQAELKKDSPMTSRKCQQIC